MLLNKCKKKIIKKMNKHNLPLTRQWNNSIYGFNKNTIKNLTIKNKIIYKLFDSYLNLKKQVKIFKKRKFSIVKVFFNVLDIKHFNNSIYITLCVFDKEKLFIKKSIYKSLRKFIFIKKKLSRENFSVNYNNTWTNKLLKIYNIIEFNDSNLFFKYKKYYYIYIKYICIKYKKLFLSKKKMMKKLFILKKRIIKLKFVNYKYNVNNFLGIKNIIYKIYNKKIEINIINLKYIYLDSYILTEALGSKLKNRKANLLKNIIKSISTVKVPYKNSDYSFKDYNSDLNNIILFTKNNLFLIKDIATIKDSMYTNIQKLGIALYNLKYKTIRGIRIEAAGRLTKRLTAKRSVHKSRQKGSLKNIYSSYYNLSTFMLLGYVKCNLQYVKKNYSNRNGSYGIKTHISSY